MPKNKLIDVPCFECGDKAKHLHHIIPESLGGTKTVPLCVTCHGIVHGINLQNHSELTKIGLQNKKLKNEWVGAAPYGYEMINKKLTEHKLEQEIINKMKILRNEGKTYAEIASYLNGENIKTRRGGVEWYPMTVYNIINNESKILEFINLQK